MQSLVSCCRRTGKKRRREPSREAEKEAERERERERLIGLCLNSTVGFSGLSPAAALISPVVQQHASRSCRSVGSRGQFAAGIPVSVLVGIKLLKFTKENPRSIEQRALKVQNTNTLGGGGGCCLFKTWITGFSLSPRPQLFSHTS